MVSIAILALLAGSATPYLEKTIQRKKESELRHNLREIRSALDAYKKAYDQGKMQMTLGDSGYPKQLQDLVYGVTDVTDPQKKKLKFLRRMPVDPMSAGPANDNADRYDRQAAAGSMTDITQPSWGIRSYDSDADNPQQGADVYDVYSLSEQVGLNGIAYRYW